MYTYILIMNVMMISRACVPTNFVQDCSYTRHKQIVNTWNTLDVYKNILKFQFDVDIMKESWASYYTLITLSAKKNRKINIPSLN